MTGVRVRLTFPADLVRYSKSLLATGAHVVATPGSAGGPARVVIVGEQGAVPPM